VSGLYQIQDLVTTYHPVGENVPQWRYVRDIIADWNVRYGYMLLELQHVIAHVLANDNDTVTASNVVKPKQWKQVLYGYFDDLVSRALIVDSAFSKASVTVSLATNNPNRFQTFFKYKRSGVARVVDTTAQGGFNYGTLN
jgi:hypothetical protein